MAVVAEQLELAMEAPALAAVSEADVVKEGLPARPLRRQYSEEVATILSEGLDLNNTTLGQVRAALEVKLGLESGALDERKDDIRNLLQEKIQQMNDEDLADEAVPQSPEAEADAQTPPPKNKDRVQKRKRRLMEAAVRLMKKCRHAEPSRTVVAEAEQPKLDGVGPLKVQIGGVEVEVPLKTLYSGRQGFHACQPITVQMGGRQMQMTCLVSCAITEFKELGSEEPSGPQTEKKPEDDEAQKEDEDIMKSLGLLSDEEEVAPEPEQVLLEEGATQPEEVPPPEEIMKPAELGA